MVIAGTKDAFDIIKKLSSLGAYIIATVTTQFGSEVLGSNKGVEIKVGMLDKTAMLKLINENDISCVVDASHPFATEVSANAVTCCEQAKIEYLRFERKRIQFNPQLVIAVKSFEQAAIEANKIDGNILLTIGSKNIDVFTRLIDNYKTRLFARVLPDSRMIEKCERVGLTANNIIALKGPFTKQMNIEIIRYCNAKVVVTKESGETGGTQQKIDAAHAIGAKVVLIERPESDCCLKVDTVEEVVKLIKQDLQKNLKRG